MDGHDHIGRPVTTNQAGINSPTGQRPWPASRTSRSPHGRRCARHRRYRRTPRLHRLRAGRTSHAPGPWRRCPCHGLVPYQNTRDRNNRQSASAHDTVRSRRLDPRPTDDQHPGLGGSGTVPLHRAEGRQPSWPRSRRPIAGTTTDPSRTALASLGREPSLVAVAMFPRGWMMVAKPRHPDWTEWNHVRYRW